MLHVYVYNWNIDALNWRAIYGFYRTQPYTQTLLILFISHATPITYSSLTLFQTSHYIVFAKLHLTYLASLSILRFAMQTINIDIPLPLPFVVWRPRRLVVCVLAFYLFGSVFVCFKCSDNLLAFNICISLRQFVWENVGVVR